MRQRQWVILYREFLFRVIDRELLSMYAAGDLHRLLAQIAAVLVFMSACLSLPAFDRGRNESALLRLFVTLSFEHFLIATTMLAVGAVAILSWGSMFPDERDVQVLAPLPIRARTILGAKLVAVMTAFGLTILAFHAVAGIVWPIALSMPEPARPFPAYTVDRAMPPVPVSALQVILDGDLREALERDWLAPGAGGGLTIGVYQRGERRLFSYGAAHLDSIFQIGSVTKPFTGFMLARQIQRGRLPRETPVRALLPGLDLPALESGQREITPEDLVTHHSGLPMMPMVSGAVDRRRPFADVGTREVYAFLRRHGVGRSADEPYVYSNLGAGLLGHLLGQQSGLGYRGLLREAVTGPLGLSDTVVVLSDDQRRRRIQGHDADRQAVPPTDFDVLEGAGALYSTAADLLAWLEANLHPPAALADAIEASHAIRATTADGQHIAFGWMVDTTTGSVSHTGAVIGYTADVFFNAKEDMATVVLANVGAGMFAAPVVGEHVRARLRGSAPASLAEIVVPATAGLHGWPRQIVAYWLTMLAASTFMVALVMGVQGVLSAILPRHYFLRVSPVLQLTTFLTLIGWYLLEPVAITHEVLQAEQRSWLSSSPSHWFLGLFQALSGSPALPQLANRALVGTALVVTTACLAYGLSYVRTLRGIGEEPDIVATAPRLRSIPMIGRGPARALVDFILKTLFRSAQPRVVMAWYWGLGLALAVGFIKTPRGQELSSIVSDAGYEPSVPLLVAGILMLAASVVAARSAFAMPRDLAANWIFKVIPVRNARLYGVARRRAMLAVTVVPVVAMAAILGLWRWHWPAPAAHVALLALLGVALVEIASRSARTIPFTCSYLPGRSRIHIAIAVTFTVVVPLAVAAATLERDALRDANVYGRVALVLACIWLGARSYSMWRTRGADPPVVFDDEPADRVLTLELWDSRTRKAEPRT